MQKVEEKKERIKRKIKKIYNFLFLGRPLYATVVIGKVKKYRRSYNI